MADGITAVVYNVTKELASRGHQVEVYASNMLKLHGRDSVCARNCVINGVKVHYSRPLGQYKTFIITPSMVPILSENIGHFDIIHIHDCRSFQGISTYMLARTRDVPYLFQPHGSYLFTLSGSLITRTGRLVLDKFISGKIIKNASKVIALSQMEAQQYKNMGVPDEKIEIIPNGIDLSEYANLPPKDCFRNKFNIDEGKKIILYLGRIHKTKGIDLLVKACVQLTKKLGYNDAILVIAGPDDGYLAEVKSLTNSLGLSDHVLFTGFLSNRDKLGALVDTDVFVTPSFYGFPLTFLEACATGTPIITTTLGDSLEWINGNVGFVVSATSYDLANVIYTVLSDDGLHRKFSSNCMKVVESKFSLEKVVDRLEQIYREIAER